MRTKGEHDADYRAGIRARADHPGGQPERPGAAQAAAGRAGGSGDTLLHLSDATFDPKTLWGATAAPVADHALPEFSDYAVAEAALSGGGVAQRLHSRGVAGAVDGTPVRASPLRVRMGKHSICSPRGQAAVRRRG